MKSTLVVSLLVVSLASTSALAAVNQDHPAKPNGTYAAQQFNSMNNGTGVHAGTNWFNKIHVSGLLNIDGYMQSNSHYLAYDNGTTTTANKTNSQSAFNVSAGVLNVDAQVNSWIDGHINLFYANSTYPQNEPMGISGKTSTRYYTGGNSESGIVFDEAYVDVGNFAQAPFVLRAGRQYLPFGQYDRYAILPSLTQQLSETRATALELAYVNTSGIHGAVYGFKGTPQKSANSSSTQDNNIRNGGVTLGFTDLSHKVGFDVGAGYLYNMRDVGLIRGYALGMSTTYVNAVGAWAAHVNVMTGPFNVGFKYVTALTSFKTDELGNFDTNSKAQPDAGNVFAGYAFKTMGYNSKLKASYQWSDKAYTTHTFIDDDGPVAFLAVPNNRLQVEYNVNILQSTMVGVTGAYDTAYDNSHNGTGDHNFTGMARLSILL